MWWDCGRWFLMQNYEKPEVASIWQAADRPGKIRRQVDVTAGT